MTIQFKPISEIIGAEIFGVDLSRPVDADTYGRIRRIWLDHNIVLFRGQQAMTPDDHMTFSRLFGTPDDHTTTSKWNLPDYPKIAVVSNVKVSGEHVGAPKSGRAWHSDGQYTKYPCSASLLVAREVPPQEGDTLFANMYRVYDALPAATRRRIDGLEVVHSRVKAWPISYPDRPMLTDEEQAKLPENIHPLVRTHPETGRRALYCGGNVGWEIVGMPFADGHALLKELRDFATEERFVYAHAWKVGDAVLWDNRCVFHCATPFDEEKYRRVMHRIHISGDKPYFAPDAP